MVALAGVSVRSSSLLRAATEGAADVNGGGCLSTTHTAAVPVQEALHPRSAAVVADRLQFLLQRHQVSEAGGSPELTVCADLFGVRCSSVLLQPRAATVG